MAISSTKQTEILKIVAGLFNAAPGGSNLSDLARQVEGGMTTSQLADALASIPLFTNGILAGKVTVDDQVSILMKNFGVTADSDATSAGSQAKAYFTQQITDGVGFGKIVFDAVTFLSTTTDTKFAVAQTLLNNKALVAAAYSKTTSSSDLSVLQNVLSNVKGDKAYTDADVTSILAGSGVDGTSGKTFTLTTSIDVISGTSGNDTIIGDFAGTSTANAGDQINGGAGNDILKIFGTYDSAKMPVSVTNVETLDIANTAAGNIDLSAWTKAATGIATVQLDNASALTGNTITTTTGQALSLSTGAANGGTAGAVTWAGSATDTSLGLTLNGYQGANGATAQALTVTGAAATTQNIASTGAANKVTTLTLGAITNKAVITGDQKLTVSTDMVSSGGATVLKTVDASATTGGVSLTFATATNAAFAFTGGSGDDSVAFADNEMGSLTSGAQLDGGAGTDKIGLLDTAISAAEYTAINAAKSFEVLGLNAAVTVDASQLTSIKSFSLDTSAAQAISNMAAGSSLAVTAAHAANITTTTGVGVHDLAFKIGTSTTGGITLGGTVNIAQDAVALSSLGTNAAANTITTLTAKDNSVYTITGSNDLTISTITAATATGSKYDASGFTGKLNITGNAAAFSAGSALGDTIIGGSGNDTIKSSVNGATMTGNGGSDIFDVSVALGGVAATAMLPVITDFTKTDKITFANKGTETFATAKFDVSGAATLAAALDLASAGDGSTNGIVKWFQFGGNTYVVEDMTAGATFAATDIAVKLTGTLDLSTSTIDTAANTLTFA